jgi:hypothetical protein
MIYRDIIPSKELEAFAHAMNTRAKLVGVAGFIDITGLRDRILSCGGRCQWCDVSVVGQAIEIDHIISLNQGGGNVPENLVVSCPSCNRKKGTKHPVTFAQEISRTASLITPFVETILKHYEAPPHHQLSLFDLDDDDR